MEDDTPWLGREEVRAWLALAGLVEALPQVLSAQLKRDAGINVFEYMLLAGLSESPGRAARMGDLAAFAAGSISRVSHALTRMEQRGWVRRQPDPESGRHTEVVLTDDGIAVVRQAAPGHVRQVRRLVVDQLGSEQTIEIGRLADRLLEAVNPEVRRMLVERYGSPPPSPRPAQAP